jgi:two-component sensor histidine kinase
MSPDRATPGRMRVLLASDRPIERLMRALHRAGHATTQASLGDAIDAVSDDTEAVLVAGTRARVLELARRLKTRYQMPLLPVVALGQRPTRTEDGAAPDVWLPVITRPREVVQRVEELVRIRRTERELVRLNQALAELAAENGRLYDRARRDAEATTTLLRELQHRVRNNLAAIQALLVLERHRTPARPLTEALDVAIARLRSMAALQDSLLPHADTVELAGLADAVARGALEVFGATATVRCEVRGNAVLPRRSASAIAIVLNELITNALKHARASEVVVDIRNGDADVAFSVSDDGRGMADAPSSGSGLMIVRAVVKNELSGTLTLLARERGTTARVEFPKPVAEA